MSDAQNVTEGDATVERVEVPEVKVPAVEAVDAAAILQALMGEIKQMKADRDADRQQFAEELAEAQRAAEAAVARAAATVVDPLRPSVLPENAIDPRTDHPATIQEKLDCMERMAEENEQPFDRERTRRSLMGLPVEDNIPFRFNGRAFDTEAELDAYKQKIEDEKLATIGKYLR